MEPVIGTIEKEIARQEKGNEICVLLIYFAGSEKLDVSCKVYRP